MTECREHCGACCDPVVSPFTLNEMAQTTPGQWPDGGANRDFMLNHLRPISRREGLRRAPYLTDGVTVMGRPGEPGSEVIAYSFFYECEFFDTDTRRCTNYDNRPPMCRMYPWYGNDPTRDSLEKSKALPRMCAFRADLGQPVEPIPVEWLGRRGE